MAGQLGRGLRERAAAALRTLRTDESGTSSLEYALLMALIVLSSLAAYQALGRLGDAEAAHGARDTAGGEAVHGGTAWGSSSTASAVTR